MSQRDQVASEIGLVKERDGLRIRDGARERIVKDDFAIKAQRAGSDPRFARELASLLISHSVAIQTGKRKRDLAGKKVLVVGGSGRMGAWFCRTLSNRGAKVEVWDPRGRLVGYGNIRRLRDGVACADIIVLTSPLGACPEELNQVMQLKPNGLVFDVCSVKSHIADQLKKAARSGLMVTSVHPMFGPNVATPMGRNVIVCACGNPKADAAAKHLFQAAGANVVNTSLVQHDRLMAYVLGLSHASILLFASTLSASGTRLTAIDEVSGPSFGKMLASARELSRESVRVYHDIQALNPNTPRMYDDLESALKDLRKAVTSNDPSAFRRIIESNRRYQEVK